MKPSSTTSTSKGRVLAGGIAHARYTVRLARSEQDIHAAQTLRFLVFNVELNEGLDHSYATLRDADPFDAICDHLVVEHQQTGEIVGTYRLQSGRVAAANRGYYSSQEFDLAPLEPLRNELIELGRACVHSQHRNLTVLSLLWQGIDLYAREHQARYLVGCSSLSTQDPAEGAALYHYLERHRLLTTHWKVQPLPGFVCPLDRVSEKPARPPKLLRAYLSLGAKICGPPAIDREFKTIDFLTFLDIQDVTPEAAARFLIQRD
ncbi:MAG: GNAT family N-acyltransferase [Verrucomicrobiota bacterium]